MTTSAPPVRVRSGAWSEELGRAETLPLPAVCGEAEITGPADVLFGYLPELDRDVRAPLREAGYSPRLIGSLGTGTGTRTRDAATGKS